jgi:hydrogenase/urease accessory protein HupE
MTRIALIALWLWVSGAGFAVAHEVRPAYLELRQSQDEHYEVLWKVPGLGNEMRLGIYVELPANCRKLGDSHAQFSNNAFIERWSVECTGGLPGHAINIAGLSATVTDVLVRIERADGTTQVARLNPGMASFIVEAEPHAWEVAGTYFRLGVAHILTGIDHLLFVLALLILVKGVKRLIATVTAFTLAHSLTLAGATLGFVHVPQPPVEACIALSIVFVAAEILRKREGLTSQLPWVIAFTFGLLHGFGFAGALSEVGLPQHAIPVALLFFNLGVEAGQLVFIAAIFSAVAATRYVLRSRGLALAAWAWRIPPYAIGVTATFWVIDRTFQFFA